MQIDWQHSWAEKNRNINWDSNRTLLDRAFIKFAFISETVAVIKDSADTKVVEMAIIEISTEVQHGISRILSIFNIITLKSIIFNSFRGPTIKFLSSNIASIPGTIGE